MNGAILDMWRGALVTILMVGGPFVVVALLVGLLTALIQAATQLQENVLSFAPKLVGVALLIALLGHWLLDQLVNYVHTAAETIVILGQVGR